MAGSRRQIFCNLLYSADGEDPGVVDTANTFIKARSVTDGVVFNLQIIMTLKLFGISPAVMETADETEGLASLYVQRYAVMLCASLTPVRSFAD